MNAIFEDEKLNREFGLPGQTEFLSANNLSAGSKIETMIENSSFITPNEDMESDILSIPLTPKVQEEAKRSSNLSGPGRVDQFCIYCLENGREIIKYNLEYKPRFKFILSSIMARLQGKICPKQDVMGHQPPRFKADSK